ncbi:MAG: ERF family protein [Deltaproteobacteria bacterium]|nr:ERF family protein [Deltaproteobacteria bacterium]
MKAKLAAAIAAAKNPPLDSVNPHFNSKYASLLSVMNAVREALATQDLALSQIITTNETKLTVKNVIYDLETGDEISFESTFPLNTEALENIQKCGSYITYCRRYSLLSLFGLVGDPDDDGNAASPPETSEIEPPTEAQRRKLYAELRERGLSKEEMKAFWDFYKPDKRFMSKILDGIDRAVAEWREFEKERAAKSCPF